MVVNCEHVWREVSNYLDGEVDPELRAAMEAHFKECKHCTAVLVGTRNVLRLYGDERMFELPAGFSQRLQRRLAQQSSSYGFRNVRSMWIMAVAAAALVVGGVALGKTVLRQPETRSPLAQTPHGVPPNLIVYVSDDSRVFHAPGCKYLHKHDDEPPKQITAAEAMKEGYVPCVRCLRQYLRAEAECPRPSPTSPHWARQRSSMPAQPGL
jgi:putative zinc finger protein